MISETGDDVAERAQARVGQTLCRKYRIDRVLGIGGMATVYAGVHRNGRRVAVKMLHPELSARRDIRARFIREALAANAVEHSGAVAVIDDDVAEDGAAFLVMERLEGKTVEQIWLDGGQRLPTRIVLAVARELCDILAAAHRAGIVHRDIKPENLFVTSDGRLKVLDFGLARLRDAARPKDTHTGMVFGTPAFMPPEQAIGETSKIDARTDIWAVGATMFTLLSGKRVHEGETAQHFIMLSATKPARSLSSVLHHAHPALVALVDHALSHDRELRWPSAENMRDAVVTTTEILLGANVRPELPGHPAAAFHVRESDAPTQEREPELEASDGGEELTAERTIRNRLAPIAGVESSSPPTTPVARPAADPGGDVTQVRAPLLVLEEDTATVERHRPRSTRDAVAAAEPNFRPKAVSDDVPNDTQRLVLQPNQDRPRPASALASTDDVRDRAHRAAASSPLTAASARTTVPASTPRALPLVIVAAAMVGISPLVYFVARTRTVADDSPQTPAFVETTASTIESAPRPLPPTATASANAPIPVKPSACAEPATLAVEVARTTDTRATESDIAPGREPTRSANAPTLSPSPSVRCAQPYRLDADGIKHWKPECLQ